MQDHQGKVAIITGSSMGIGRTLAREMAQRGIRMVLNARNAERLQATWDEFKAEGWEAIAVAGDVSKPADCQAVVAKALEVYGRLDILVNNAGVATQGELELLSPDIFRKVVEVNLLGTTYMTQAAIPALKNSKGSVLMIGSAAGIRGLPGHSAYSSSKMALTALAESLKLELYDAGVHVGIAYVGFTENDPRKVIYDSDGKIIPQPGRSFIKQEPVEVVAKRLFRMIENRTFKSVFTPLGKLNAIINKFVPKIGEMVLLNNFRKQKAEG